jgi:hypothetical protein
VTILDFRGEDAVRSQSRDAAKNAGGLSGEGQAVLCVQQQKNANFH